MPLPDHHPRREISTRRRRRWRVGCLMAAAVLAIVVALAIYFLGRPVRAAKRIEQTLNETYSQAAAFTPANDGTVPPERIEAFLRVRRRVYERCDDIADIRDETIRLETIENDPGSSGSAKVVRALQSFRQLLTYGPRFLDFMNARNGALLEEEMGLGEYMYIYVLAYGEQLRGAAEADSSANAESLPGTRARRELAAMLGNQLAALGSATSSPDAALAASLERQIRALDEGRLYAPWADGLPPRIRACFEPYRDELARYHCPGMAALELTQKNQGLDIRN